MKKRIYFNSQQSMAYGILVLLFWWGALGNCWGQKIPEPSKKELKAYGILCREYVCKDFRKMYRKGCEGAFRYPYLTPGSASYANVLWDWDSWLSDVALQQVLQDVGTEADRKEALPYEQGCILNYLSYTGEDGYMPMVISKGTDPNLIKPKDIYSTNMHKPCIAQHAALLIRQNNGDAEWLRSGFHAMTCFIKNYKEHHRHKETGLYYWQDDLAIGVDNDPSTFFRPNKSSASIYLNCLMYRELLAMSYIAKCLGKTSEATGYISDADSLKAAVREYCWDEKDGMYYSVDLNLRPITNESQIIFGTPMVLHKGGPRTYSCLIQRIGCWSGFMAMWAGIATKEQAVRMVKENLMDERTFWSPYGVRTLSRLEKMYSMRKQSNPSNWWGPIWGISNYMVFRGLVKYGMNKEARELANRHIHLFGKDLKENGSLHEYYVPETGRPVMNAGFLNWNLLVLNMMDWMENKAVVEE
jgi:hypothetical protein